MFDKAWMLLLIGNLQSSDRPPEYYLQKFYQEEAVYAQSCYPHPDIRIVLTNLPKPTAGICDQTDPVRIVELDRKWWTKASELEREELMFHELGHCILNRGHKEGNHKLHGKVIPRSVMKCCGFLGSAYKKYREYYLWELFNSQ